MDLLNLGGDERLDFGDLTYALNQVPAGLLSELSGSFLVPTGTSTIISGFAPSGSGQGPVQVGATGVPNLALLGQRVAGAITQGVFSAVGPQTINLSVANLPANTYGVYVRFNRIPGAAQTRKFWSKAAPGSEYGQLADTRLVAAWEARLETSQPSAEWLLVGQAVVTAAGSGQGNTVVVTDQRPLYFEGTPAGGYAPVWGSAADRVSDRRQTTISTLQQELDALRQCIVDIKGRGLATWYQPNISGMQVGSGFTLASQPSQDQIAVGDSNFYLGFVAGNNPSSTATATIAFAGTSDQLSYLRGTGTLSRIVNNQTVLSLYQNGAAVFGAGLVLAPSQAVINQVSTNVSGYGLIIQAPTAPASLGLFSASSTTAFVELSPRAGMLYGALSCSWSSTPTTSLIANTRAFITGAASGNSTAISLIGNSVSVGSTGAALSVGGRPTPLGGVVWATGYYSFGRNFVYASCVPGTTATATQNKDQNGNTTSVTISFSSAIPVATIVVVTPVFGQGGSGNFNNRSLAPQYQVTNTTQLSVILYNDNAETVATDFSFAVFYGS